MKEKYVLMSLCLKKINLITNGRTSRASLQTKSIIYYGKI